MDRPVSTIEDPNDVVIRIAFTGVCGSDVRPQTNKPRKEKSLTKTPGPILAPRRNQETRVSIPLVMSHEASGIVHANGAAVTTLQTGDHVAIAPGIPCRTCRRCKMGKYNLCHAMKFAASPAGLVL